MISSWDTTKAKSNYHFDNFKNDPQVDKVIRFGRIVHDSKNDISINELLSHSQPKTFLKGSTIIASGELSTSMYIVITGNVGKTRGGKSTTIIEAGSFFGATAMITGETCTSDYIAIAPKVLLFQLEHDTAKNHLPVEWLLAN